MRITQEISGRTSMYSWMSPVLTNGVNLDALDGLPRCDPRPDCPLSA
jgi:hypothetical protein